MKMISLRLNDKELEALSAAAAGDKLKLTTWIKRSALLAADGKAPQQPPAIQAQSAATTPPTYAINAHNGHF